ncbi:MAG: HD domain-containing protein [Deltaproteobacteria bacterium]
MAELARAKFHRMDESTPEDWMAIATSHIEFTGGTTKRVLKHLALLDGDYGGFAVDRLTHSLQTATMAMRDGRDEEYVVCALLHDIGDTLAPTNHPSIAAGLLKPWVSPENHWIVEHHGIFQGYYFWHHLGGDRDEREHFRDHEWFDACAEFCDLYDQRAFDPKAETLPLSEFEPLVHRVFAEGVAAVVQVAAEA